VPSTASAKPAAKPTIKTTAGAITKNGIFRCLVDTLFVAAQARENRVI
jgi:hypothetical protein